MDIVDKLSNDISNYLKNKNIPRNFKSLVFILNCH